MRCPRVRVSHLALPAIVVTLASAAAFPDDVPSQNLSFSELAARGELTTKVVVDRAESIYSGTCTGLSSYYSEDGRTIYTDVTLRVSASIKGREEQQVTFTTPGGKVGDTFLTVIPFPSFELGEEAVVFLRNYAAGSMYPLNATVLSGASFAKRVLDRSTPERSARADDLVSHLRDVAAGTPGIEPIALGACEPPITSAATAAAKVLAVPQIESVSSVRLDWVPSHPQGKTLTDTLTITGSGFGTGPCTGCTVQYQIWNDGLQTQGANHYPPPVPPNPDFFLWSDTKIKLKLRDNATSGNVAVCSGYGNCSTGKQYNVRFNTKPIEAGYCYWTNARASSGIRYYFVPFTSPPTSPTGTVTDVMWTGETYNDADGAVDNAFDAWDAASTNLAFIDGGQEDYVRCFNDRLNVVIWENHNDPSAVAFTYATGDATADTLTDVDISFDYRNGYGGIRYWSASDNPGSSTPYDIWNIAAHEVGHLLGCWHGYGSPDSDKTMYWSASSPRETKKRSLTADDAALATWLYQGAPKPTTPANTGVLTPGKLYLQQNYPNPFNPQTTIRFGLLDPARVDLAVYNALGQKVRTLASGQFLRAGDHHFLWDSLNDDGQPVSSGVYYYQLSSEAFSFGGEMTLIR